MFRESDEMLRFTLLSESLSHDLPPEPSLLPKPMEIQTLSFLLGLFITQEHRIHYNNNH